MKRHVVLVLGLVLASSSFLLPGSSFSQVPELINYQGRLVDTNGLVNGNREIVLRLETQAGAALYAETQNVTVVDGLYSFHIGASNAVPGALATALNTTGVWLKVEVDGSALVPRARVTASGYALKAAAVEDMAITTAMLRDNAVTAAKVQDNSLDFSQLKTGLTLDGNTLITLTGSRSLSFNLTGSGDVMFQNLGGGFAEFRDNGDVSVDGTTLFVDNDVSRVGIGDLTPEEKLTVFGNIAPSQSGTFDLGTDAMRWRNIYLASKVDYTSGLEFVSGTDTGMTLAATGDLTVTGNVTAAAFTGDGSGLTGLPAGDHGALSGLGDDDHPQYLRSDDADVYNEAGADIDLRFKGTGKEGLLFLDASADRVGIGATNLQHTLQIVGSPTRGSLLIAPDASPSGGHAELRLAEDRNGTFAWILRYDGSASQLQFMRRIGVFSTNSPALVIKNGVADQVGIGTTSPVAKLDVRQPFSFLDALRVSVGSTNALTVSGSARVGVGTTNPLAGVHIHGLEGTASLLLTPDDAVGGGDSEVRLSEIRDGIFGWIIRNNGGSNQLQVLRRSGVNATNGPFLVVDAAGRTGIGHGGPEVLLHVANSAIDQTSVRIDNTGGGDAALQFALGALPKFAIGVDRSSVNKDFVISGGSFVGFGNRLTIDGLSGNVGIGRNPAVNTLEVEGNASKTTAGGWLANSDRAIKTDIEELENACQVINKLRPVRFRYSDAYRARHPSIEDRPYYNFVAQEFATVFPDQVRDDGTGLLQMDAYPIGPYLVAAVQELGEANHNLRAMNDELRRRMAAMEAALQQARDRLAALEVR